jgi:hypothetical protein
VQTAIANACSPYWQQSLGGRALCVHYDTGMLACRISPPIEGFCHAGIESGGIVKDDAVIELTAEGPKPYSITLGSTLPNNDKNHSFLSAAVRAAYLQWLPSINLSPDAYNAFMDENATIINHHIAELKKSSDEWVENSPGVLDAFSNRMLGIKSAATSRCTRTARLSPSASRRPTFDRT